MYYVKLTTTSAPPSIEPYVIIVQPLSPMHWNRPVLQHIYYMSILVLSRAYTLLLAWELEQLVLRDIEETK